MSLDLNKLANKLDKALSNETSETLTKFLNDKRMSNNKQSMIKIIVHDQQWFINRIGKRIYRKENYCQCPICVNVHKVGLIVIDKNHAIYLFDCQSMDISYHDKP